MEAIRGTIESAALAIETVAVAIILIATVHGTISFLHVPQLVVGRGNGRALAMEEVIALHLTDRSDRIPRQGSSARVVRARRGGR